MRSRCLSLLVCMLATAGVATSPAVAATLTVNTTGDDTSPFDGMCSLREAIAAVDFPGSQAGRVPRRRSGRTRSCWARTRTRCFRPTAS